MFSGVGVFLVASPGVPGDELEVALSPVMPGLQRLTPDARGARALLVVLVLGAEPPLLSLGGVRRAWPGVPVVVSARALPVADVIQLMRQPRVDVVLAEEGARGVLQAIERALPAAAGLAAALPAAAAPALAPPTGAPAAPLLSAASGAVPPAPTAGQGDPTRPRAPAPARGPDDLPVLDQRAGLVQQLMAREECSIGDVETVVATEPRLVTSVVRTANSAYYHAPRVITNLHDAIVRIGVRQTLAILLETLVQRSFQPMHPEAQAVLSAAWENAGLTARFARRLAEWESLGRAEDVYLAALLHNIGECLLVWRLYRTPVRPGQLVEESPRIAAHHESAAELAVERWGMPPLVASLAAFHHRARLGETPRDAALRRIVVGAWALARELQGDYLPDLPPVDPSVELPRAVAERLVRLAAPEFVGHPALILPAAAAGA